MKTIILIIAVVCLAICYANQHPVTPARAASIGVDYAVGEVILTFKPEHMPVSENITTSPLSVGITALDEIFSGIQATSLTKIVPSYDELTTQTGQRIERTFLLSYASTDDPVDVVADFMSEPYFESVTVNALWSFELSGMNRIVPGDTTRFVDQWYFDNSDEGDKSDIDMPEAWAIERGNPSLVIGIFDSGMLVDRCLGTTWRLHSDFNHLFLTGEDQEDPGVLSDTDLNELEDNGDAFIDNVVGTNLAKGCESCQAQYPDWKALPHDWTFGQPPPPSGCFPDPGNWDIGGFNDHGTRVAGIAAGKMDGLKKAHPDDQVADHKDIVGVAPDCKIYNVRFGCPLGDAQAAIALQLLATHCKVVNMSFGVYDLGEFEDSTLLFSEMVSTVTHEPTYDCVLIATVGNGQQSGNIQYPARYADVLAVGGISRLNSLGTQPLPQRVNYSKYHSSQHQVDIMAPIETQPQNTSGILSNRHSTCGSGGPCTGNLNPSCSPIETVSNTSSGTSFAAPQVSGVAALVRSRFPGLNQAQVKERLLNSAEHYDYWGTRPSYQYGNGKVNAYRALTEWGEISANTTWSPTATRDGKYYVSGDLTIEAGVTLTIAAGTTVLIAPDHEESGADPDRVQIIVEGTLNIVGTSENPVVFESFHDGTPANEDWIGISFDTGSSGNLENVVFRNARCAIENHANVEISGCKFADCLTAIKAYADIDASGTVVSDNFTGLDIYAGTTELTKCTIAENSGSATITRTGTTQVVSKCVFAFNGGPVARVASGGTSNTTMSNSIVYSNLSALNSLGDATWPSVGTNVFNENPAFCDPENGDYRLYAFSPAVKGPHFAERVGALPMGCVPDAEITTSLAKACPQGDGLVPFNVDIAFDESVMTRDIGTSEIVLDHRDIDAKVFNNDSTIQANLAATAGTDYHANISHQNFGYFCKNDPVDVLLNGFALEEKALLHIRTLDCAFPFGIINIFDGALFGNHYTSPPKSYNPACDIDDSETVVLVDFAYLSAHYNHKADSTIALINAPPERASSTASIALAFTEEFPTATTHKLYVDVSVENFLEVQTSIFAMVAGSERLAFQEWQPSENQLGTVLFTPVIRDEVQHLFFGAFVSDTFTGAGALLGRLVFDVSGTEPFEVTSQHFALVIGDVLLETSGTGLIEAGMNGSVQRTFDPQVARVYHDRLEQNYPNPFNPSTTLAYSLKSPNDVNLMIYDVAGRRVRELVNERRERGAYKVVWDGRNDQGAPVASGVYFYKLIVGTFTDTKKMTILK